MVNNPEYQRRNYLFAIIEGGFFMGGMQFLSMESVMPAMMRDLGGPGWAISIGPALFIVGFTWPQILSAIWVERMRRMKPMVITLGAIQRIPYLLAGLFLINFGKSYPTQAMYIALTTPFLMSSIGGLQGAAYFEMVSRIVPLKRIASMWAIRNLIMAGCGITAGLVIKEVLDSRPGTTGYGILHLITFSMMLVSLILLAQIKETNIPDMQKQDPVTFKSGFGVFFQQWSSNPSFGRFVITRILFMMIFALIPFLSIQAIDKTGQSTGIVGTLLAAQMTGFVLGNIVSGYLGDRFGVRKPMILGRMLLMVGIILAPVSTVAWQFIFIFFTLGFGLSTAQVGDLTMVFDFAPPEKRKFFFALMGLMIVPGVLSASLISAALQYINGGFYYAALVSGIGVASSLYFLLRMRDPRSQAL